MSTIRPHAEPKKRWDRLVEQDGKDVILTVALGNMTQLETMFLMKDGPNLVVGIRGDGFKSGFSILGPEMFPLHWQDVKKYLNVENTADAKNITDLLNSQMDMESPVPEWGEYNEKFSAEG